MNSQTLVYNNLPRATAELFDQFNCLQPPYHFTWLEALVITVHVCIATHVAQYDAILNSVHADTQMQTHRHTNTNRSTQTPMFVNHWRAGSTKCCTSDHSHVDVREKCADEIAIFTALCFHKQWPIIRPFICRTHVNTNMHTVLHLACTKTVSEDQMEVSLEDS